MLAATLDQSTRVERFAGAVTGDQPYRPHLVDGATRDHIEKGGIFPAAENLIPGRKICQGDFVNQVIQFIVAQAIEWRDVPEEGLCVLCAQLLRAQPALPQSEELAMTCWHEHGQRPEFAPTVTLFRLGPVE
jgi:hypothetical protein